MILSTIIGIGVIAFVSWTWWGNKSLSKRLRKVNDSRPTLSKEEYIRQLSEKGFDSNHLEVIYDEIHGYLDKAWFCMYPEDDLIALYEVDDEDLVDVINTICKKLGLKLPTTEDWQEIGSPKFSGETIAALTQHLAMKNED